MSRPASSASALAHGCSTFLCSRCLRRLLSFFSTLPPSLHSKNSSLETEQAFSRQRTAHTRFQR